MAKRIVRAVVLILVAFFTVCRGSTNKVEEKKQIRLPAINLKGMEPQVAQKIVKQRSEVQQNPNSAGAWGKLGMTLDVHGLREESVQCYQKAAELDQSDFRWPYYCAIALKELGSPDALKWFQEGIRRKPDYAPEQIRYAKALFDAGKASEAEKHYHDALRADGKSPQAYVGLAQIAMLKNDMNAAKGFAEKTIELNPKEGEAFSLLSVIYRRINDQEKAQQALAMAQQLPEKSAMVDPVYAALVAEGESAYWYRTRGRTYLESGLYEMALHEFQTALKLHQDADAYDNIGVALQGLGRLQEAIEYHKKAIAMNPDYLKYYNLGIAYGKQGQFPQAAGAFRNSVRLKPDYAESYYNLGVAYFKLSDWKNAIENLQKAVHYNENHAGAHYALGIAYLATGDRTRATHEYETLQKLNPELARRFAEGH